MDYNTQRKKLILPEYGRCIQQMVDYAKTIGDRAERQNCANTIIALMANMQEQRTDPDELRNKLWNHLAAMADYELDIDYPVEIVHHEEAKDKRERLPYPQHIHLPSSSGSRPPDTRSPSKYTRYRREATEPRRPRFFRKRRNAPCPWWNQFFCPSVISS